MAKLTMVLAKGPGRPDGDLDDRLIVRLVLNRQGQIDPSANPDAPTPWLAIRTRPGMADNQYELLRLDDGRARQSMASEDDPLWTFEGFVFRPGDLVRLGRPDGEGLLFRIVASTPD